MASHLDSRVDNEEKTKERLKLTTPPDPTIPRLYYFDARGRAEIIRIIFALRNVTYEDIRCRRHPHAMEDFEVLKRYKTLPFGQVPLLEIDGLALAQSQAILRYIGRKHNLIGVNEQETALVDMIACATEDIRQKFTSSIFSWKDPDAEPYLCKFKSETCPQWGHFLNQLLESNGGIWFVGTQLTYADLAVYDMITHIQLRIPDAFQQFLLLRAHACRIQSIPEISAWLQSRPETSV